MDAFFMEFIYLLTLCIDFSLPLAALASGMLSALSLTPITSPATDAPPY